MELTPYIFHSNLLLKFTTSINEHPFSSARTHCSIFIICVNHKKIIGCVFVCLCASRITFKWTHLNSMKLEWRANDPSKFRKKIKSIRNEKFLVWYDCLTATCSSTNCVVQNSIPFAIWLFNVRFNFGILFAYPKIRLFGQTVL